MCSVRHGASRYCRCDRSATSSENMIQGTKSPNPSLLATTETQRNLECLKKVVGIVSGTSQVERRRWALKEVLSLLCKHSLPE